MRGGKEKWIYMRVMRGEKRNDRKMTGRMNETGAEETIRKERIREEERDQKMNEEMT